MLFVGPFSSPFPSGSNSQLPSHHSYLGKHVGLEQQLVGQQAAQPFKEVTFQVSQSKAQHTFVIQEVQIQVTASVEPIQLGPGHQGHP